MSQVTEISGHTHLVSLLGSPIRHSMSPATHNLSFQKLGVDTVYVVFDVKQDDLPDILNAMRRMDGWDGSNVTMPCKQAVIPLLDGISEEAETMGAVNVLKKDENGKIIGYNTDGIGFMNNLRKHGVNTKGETMTLIGPGGAGSAITVQAAFDGAKTIHVFAREGGPSYTKSTTLIPKLIEKTGCDVQLHAFEDKETMKKCLAESDIVVNATPVGMADLKDETPVAEDLYDSHIVVAECPYSPRVTRFMKEAEAKGCKTIGGIGMMIEQAASGEEIWYGVQMPTDEIVAELFPDD